jgi:hypothetical protein
MIERAAAGGGLELKAHPYAMHEAKLSPTKGRDTRAIQGWLS